MCYHYRPKGLDLCCTHIAVYGGAIAQIPDQATSYAHRDAVFNVQFYSWVKDGDKYPDSGIDFINGLAKTLDPNPYASCKTGSSSG